MATFFPRRYLSINLVDILFDFPLGVAVLDAFECRGCGGITVIRSGSEQRVKRLVSQSRSRPYVTCCVFLGPWGGGVRELAVLPGGLEHGRAH